MLEIKEILDFWFGKPEDKEYGKPRKAWFVKNAQFDKEISDRFLPIYQQAAQEKLNYWQEAPDSCLALILLLDQFPRNMFRNQPLAFATDELARKFATEAVSQGFDKKLLPVQRWFIYLPFEHSENLEHQYKAVELFSTLLDDPDSADCIEYAYRHLKTIERFGRFPHRNPILGRQNTPEEAEFLKEPASSF